MYQSIVATLLACLTLQALANPFPAGDEQTGKNFFDQNRCNRCHVRIVGGDGSFIFTRPDHKVTNPQQLVTQMRFCSSNIHVTLTQQNEQDLGTYLNNNFYKFK